MGVGENTGIHIDVCVPFYLYESCPQRMYITKIIFRHYMKVIRHCKTKYGAKITMTFVGSEKDISKNFVRDNFEGEPYTHCTYHEFDQKNSEPAGDQPTFYNMLAEKFRFSYKKSMEKQPHISLLAGSNDYISLNFFEQLIDEYDPNKKQLFGVSNFYKGKNLSCVEKYVDNKVSKSFWYTGKFSPPRDILHYAAGIIGFNNVLYKTHYDILHNTMITFDEAGIELHVRALPDVHQFFSKNVFFVNIKSSNKSEITQWDDMFQHTVSERLHPETFDTETKEYFKTEYTDFVSRIQEEDADDKDANDKDNVE